MKKSLLLLSLFFLMNTGIFAQTECGPAQSFLDFNANNIRAFLSPNGGFFNNPFDFSSGFQVPYSPDSISNPGSIYASGLWLGGVDPAGNLKTAVATYTRDYSPGPLDAIEGTTNPENCSHYDKIWVVNQSEILAHLADFQDNGVIDDPIPAIFSWPGLGNPSFLEYNGFELPATNQQMAWFFDSDDNGNYDPAAGDYPMVEGLSNIPAKIAWYVINDAGAIHTGSQGNPIQMEVQVTTYAYVCNAVPELNNALFLSLKMINRAVEDIDSLYMGFWSDFDLGCYQDDYVGCNPELNTFFTYNSDNDDANCQGVPGYGENPPVQAITYLNKPLSGFRHYYNANFSGIPAISDPETSLEYYNYLTGTWKDGKPMTQGGIGYNPGSTDYTNWSFPDNPQQTDGWSMYNMSTQPGDFRALGVANLDILQPGGIQVVDLCLSYHREQGLDNLQNVDVMETEVASLKNLYENGFSTACLVSKEPILHNDQEISLFPNPASAMVTIRSGRDKILAYSISDMQGKAIFHQSNIDKKEVSVTTGSLAQGIYQVAVILESGVYSTPLVIVR